MVKVLMLRDQNTGKYFTDSYGEFWSSKIEDAKRFSLDTDMDLEVERLNNSQSNMDNILVGINFVEVVTIYTK